MYLRFPLLHCLPFLGCTPFWKESGTGDWCFWEGEWQDGLQPLVCVVICSELSVEVIKPLNGSQFRSFLLNRSIQENGELKIESKIEEVGSLSCILLLFFSLCLSISVPFLCLYLSWGSLMLTCDFENISSRITPLEESFLWVSICPFDQGVTYCKFYHRGKMDLRVCLTFQVTFPEILREREVSTFTRNGGQCQHPLTPAGAVRRTGPTQMLGLGEHRECPCTQMGKPTPAHGKLASSVDYLPST